MTDVRFPGGARTTEGVLFGDELNEFLGDPTELSEVVVTAPRRGVTNPFSISTFIDEINKRDGLLNPNLYTVEITLPSWSGAASDTKTLSILCDSAQIPGLALGTDDTIQRFGYGPTHRAVWGMVFTPLTLEFVVDGQGSTHKAITRWFNSIVLYNDSGHEAQPASEYSGMPFMVNYQEEFAKPIKVYNHDARGGKAIMNHFMEAYPIRLSEVQLNNNIQSGLVKITVTFSYVRHVTEYLSLDNSSNGVLSEQNSIAASTLRNSLQAEPPNLIANDLNQRYSSIFTPVTTSLSNNQTDTSLQNTNGMFARTFPRPVDLDFDPNTLFF